MSDKLIVIDTPEGIHFAHLLSLRGALRLESIGLKRRGSSALSIAKREFGLKRSTTSKQAYEHVDALIKKIQSGE